MIIIFFLFLFIQVKAEASPIVIQKGKDTYTLNNLDILEDSSGKLTIADVNKPEWAKKFKKSTDIIPKFRFSSSTFWARFIVKNNNEEKVNWVLSQKYFFLDEIEFFKKRKDKWESLKTGDNFPYDQKLDSRHLSFNIGPKENALYFVKIKGIGAQFFLTISSLKKAHSFETRENFIFGLFFGLILTLIAYNFFNFISSKDFNYLFYLGFIAFFGLKMASTMGFNQKVPFQKYPFFSSCTFLLFIQFSTFILKLKEAAPKLNKVLHYFYFINLLPILFSLQYALALSIYSVWFFPI